MKTLLPFGRVIPQPSFIVLLFVLFTFSTVAFGQPCEVNIITTQAQIDDFATDYPGCTCIEFSSQNGASIAGVGITNLDGLSQVTKVVGSFRIVQTNITSMSGLENLDTVTQEFQLVTNDLLTNLNDLANLNSTYGLTVAQCNSLLDLKGLEGINRLNNISISFNANLTSLDGLEGLTDGYPNGNNTSYINFSITNNPLLTNFDGLSNYVGNGQFHITDNNSLLNINGLNNAKPCGSVTNIENNPQLTVCNNDWLCEILIKDYNGNPAQWNIINNAPGCNSKSEVLAQCNPEDFYVIDTTIYFCEGASVEYNGVTYSSDTLICEDVATGEVLTISTQCYDTRCARLLTKVPYGNDTRQVGCDIYGEANDDLFGRSVSLSADGKRVAVGAPWNDGNGSNAGHVRIYEFNGGAWVQIGDDIDGIMPDEYSGYSMELSSDGNRVVIGAYNHLNGLGQVRVYEYDGGEWTSIGQNLDGESLTWFGHKVSISKDGNRIAATLPFYDVINNQINGQTRVYEFNGISWVQLGNSIDFLEFHGDDLRNISLSGDGSRIALGSPTNGGSGTSNVRVFELNNGNWELLGSIIEQEFPFDWSGRSLSLSDDGSILAVGEPRNGEQVFVGGQTRVFEYTNGDWIQMGSDLYGDESGNSFGETVSLSGDGKKLAVGSYKGFHVYKYSNNEWMLEMEDVNSYPSINPETSVAISNDGNLVAEVSINSPSNGILQVFQCADNFVSIDTTIYICQGETVEVDCNTYSTDTIVCYNQIANYGNGDVCYQYCTELIVVPTSSENIMATICEGENYPFNGMLLTNDTSFCNTLPNSFGCDSTVCLELMVVPAIETSETTFVCPEDYTVPQLCATFSSVISGCDSTHCIDYVIADTFYTTQNETICDGDFFTFDGINYTTDTSFCNTYMTVFGCDSTVCFSLSVTDSILVQDMVFICEGETYPFNGILWSTDTTVCNATQTNSGCDSTYCLIVNVLDTIVTQENVSLCQGDEFTYEGQSATINSTLCATFTGINDCDSTHCINVFFLDTSYVEETVFICPGETFPFNGMTLNNDTTVCVLEMGSNGCDSTYCLTLELLDTVTTNENATICQGDFYDWNGTLIDADTLLCEVLIGANGCDSTHCITLSVADTIAVQQVEELCFGDSYDFGGNILTTDTTLCLTFPSSLGCDSVHCVSVSILDTVQVLLFPAICEGATFTVGNATYNEEGLYAEVLSAANGCDSTIITDLTVYPNPGLAITVGDDVCLGDLTTLDAGAGFVSYAWSSGAITQTIEVADAGFYSVTVTDDNNCSWATSIDFAGPVMLELNVAVSDYSGFQISCEGLEDGSVTVEANGGGAPYNYEWSNGANTSDLSNLTAGSYTLTITDVNGCTISDTIELMAPPGFTATYDITEPSCFGENDGSLIVETSGSTAPYQYYLDGILRSAGIFNTLVAGTYELQVIDANQCSYTEMINITEPAETIVEIDPSSVVLQLGDSIQLSATTNANSVSVRWMPANNLSCDTCLLTQTNVLTNTAYQVSVWDENGCLAEETVEVRVTNEKLVYIPNLFTPNGDGFNDEFMVHIGAGVEQVNRFEVFNRWGKLVHSATGFGPNDGTAAWTPSNDSEDHPAGVYVYFVEVLYANGIVEVIKGDVTLMK